jgi:hypothetical protein
MMITPAATPPEAPGQMPQAGTPGPAPVPYGGGSDQRPEPPLYGADLSITTPGAGVMDSLPAGNAVQETAPFPATVAPYYPGAISPVHVHGDADAGGRDDVAATVAGAVASAEARFAEHMSDAHAGSVIGDLMAMPPSALDPAASSPGTTDPSGAFYDPPRNY